MNKIRLILNWLSLLALPIYLPFAAFFYALYFIGQTFYFINKGRLSLDQQRVLKSGEQWLWG